MTYQSSEHVSSRDVALRQSKTSLCRLLESRWLLFSSKKDNRNILTPAICSTDCMLHTLGYYWRLAYNNETVSSHVFHINHKQIEEFIFIWPYQQREPKKTEKNLANFRNQKTLDEEQIWENIKFMVMSIPQCLQKHRLGGRGEGGSK